MSEADIASESAVREVLDARHGHPGLRRGGGRRARRHRAGSSTRSTAPRTSCTASTRSACRSGSSSDGQPVVGVVHAPLLGPTARRPHLLGHRGRRRVPRRPADLRQRPPARAGDRRDRLPVPPQAPAARPPRNVRSRAPPLRGPPARRGRQPRPVLDRGRRLRRLLRAAPRSVGRRRRRAIVIREAGGIVTDWAGATRAWLGSGDILAAPPAVHAALLELASLRSRTEPTSSPTAERRVHLHVPRRVRHLADGHGEALLAPPDHVVTLC